MLTGLRVLDLTRVLAGPLCTMMLGDLGADVIKVERPGAGDETRGWGPPFDSFGVSAYFTSINRNKLSLQADLDDRVDAELVGELIESADIVVDNFRPGTLERRGIDPASVLARHPAMVWCTITGFGEGSARPGYDFVVQAECGWMAITGERDGDPMKVGVALADVIAGKDAAIAILSALVSRDARSRGERVFISLADSARAALVNVAQNVLVTGREAERWGNGHPNLVPYQLFHCADAPIVIAVGSDAQWRACTRALSLPALHDDATLASNAGRQAARGRIADAIAQRVASDTAASWVERLASAGVPVGLVRGVLDALRDTAATAAWGVPSSVGGRVRLAPPRLDEHGSMIRREGWGVFTSIGGRSARM